MIARGRTNDEWLAAIRSMPGLENARRLGDEETLAWYYGQERMLIAEDPASEFQRCLSTSFQAAEWIEKEPFVFVNIFLSGERFLDVTVRIFPHVAQKSTIRHSDFPDNLVAGIGMDELRSAMRAFAQGLMPRLSIDEQEAFVAELKSQEGPWNDADHHRLFRAIRALPWQRLDSRSCWYSLESVFMTWRR